MSERRTRADERLEAWASATRRPAPEFIPPAPRRRQGRVLLIAAALVILLAALGGTLAIGSLPQASRPTPPTADLVRLTGPAIAATPAVGYTLSIAVSYPEGVQRLDARGAIDFEAGRFAGTANGGGGGMLLFGGPSSGEVVLADGLFVRTEGGPWEAVPVDGAEPLGPFLDRDTFATAIAGVVGSAAIDPTVESAACAIGTCRLVRMSVATSTVSSVLALMFGNAAQPGPPDLGPIDVELLLDPATGFPVRTSIRATAGPTTTVIVLDLVRLDPPPAIVPPIP